MRFPQWIMAVPGRVITNVFVSPAPIDASRTPESLSCAYLVERWRAACASAETVVYPVPVSAKTALDPMAKFMRDGLRSVQEHAGPARRAHAKSEPLLKRAKIVLPGDDTGDDIFSEDSAASHA